MPLDIYILPTICQSNRWRRRISTQLGPFVVANCRRSGTLVTAMAIPEAPTAMVLLRRASRTCPELYDLGIHEKLNSNDKQPVASGVCFSALETRIHARLAARAHLGVWGCSGVQGPSEKRRRGRVRLRLLKNEIGHNNINNNAWITKKLSKTNRKPHTARGRI